ncbi:MAG: hypothetical protein ACXVLQ_04875 [Bacteriovorax sp.]
MKKLVGTLISLAMTLAIAAPAFATCDVDKLHVLRSEGPYEGGVFYYDLAPIHVTPDFYYRYSTNNPQLITQMDSAWVGDFTVRAIGDATACGDTGTIRDAGNLIFLYRDTVF